jgi:hypothetical protein
LQENQAATARLPEKGRVSSPASTGGAGTFFEQHVAAYWLAQLLVRAIPPILIDRVVAEVHFQTEHLGWQTDDFLIVCERTNLAGQKKLAGQVKRSFTVSAADDDCKQTIQDFWNDFKSSDRFSPDDRLVLVTLRGTETLLKHFVGLLDCARAAGDGAKFQQRLVTKGFISEKAVQYCGELRKIIGEIEGKPVTAADIWPFLRVLHVLNLDLDSATRQTEAYIKSLLAHTGTEADAVGSADVSWNALLALASTAMSEARSLCRADLPRELQERHASVGMDEQRVLRALKDHTDLVLRGIRSTFGKDFHLQRDALVQKVLDELETAQVVLVSGPAGSGKSAIGKGAVSLLSQDHFTFGFRVEEFAQPHFDATLHAGQIPATGTTLGAILAAQGRKVVLVESVERLLERTTRDAFSDLMTLAASDPGMRIILTCRDYSIDQVRASFLQPAGIKHGLVSVPPLDDAELAEIQAALPALVHPLKNPSLRNILRNPYFLDKALEISWSAERLVPESEREFRVLFWREIVRADQRVPAGMARRREEVFQTIAIRRARALSAYVVCNDLDPVVISALRQDSLISSPEENLLFVATAHDVLEDWAILQWLEEQHLTGEGSFKDLSVAIGAYPAVRRSYRKWVAELVERDTTAADRLFRAAIAETEITAQFRDDTLVSLLKAPSSPEFLLWHEAQLVANDRALLKQVIHLLRVACVTTPVWLVGTTAHGSIFNVPDGLAWATVLGLVHRNIDSFMPQERSLLLGLIEDAVRNVSWWAPDLDGAKFVAGIGHWLLAGFDNYSSDDPRKRVLQVIAKIPKADAARFEAVLRGTIKEGERRDRIADDFREIIFSGLDGMPAARDLPDLIVSVAVDHLLASEEDLRSERYPRSSLDLETHFGIKERVRHDFPASAIRGPWGPLLRHHPRQALDFFIRVFNHSADWYAHPRVHDPLEPAWEIELTFADGSVRKQWGNPRLWNLYRGTSVGPYVLQCMLMALEKWLLDLASQQPQQLDGVLVDILRWSDSAALASVVASVATAYPHACGEALLVLLSAPDYIAFDRGRMASERQVSAWSGMFPQLRADDKVYEEERKEVDRLPHRGQDLEAAIANLQLGPLASRVHALLDRHLASLPPKSEQNDSDLVWRLAVHRMDLRQYIISDTSEPKISDAEGNAGEPANRYIRLEPKAPDPDVQAMVTRSAASLEAMNAGLGLLMWGLSIFRHEENANYDPAHWRQRLAQARSLVGVSAWENEPNMAQGGPGICAAVCVRDHWQEMSNDEQDWCVEVVCSEVLRQADVWNSIEREQRYDMSADRSCAKVLPLLLGKTLSEPLTLRVREAFVTGFTHAIHEVQWYATWGIAKKLWTIDRELTLRCVNAIAMGATLIDQAWGVEEERPYKERRQISNIEGQAMLAIRQRFWELDFIAKDAYERLDISEWFGAEANNRILAILGQAPEESAALAGFKRSATTLVAWWDADDERNRRRSERRRERNHQTASGLSELLQDFVIHTSPSTAGTVLEPILEKVERHPREIHWLVRGLTSVEDREPNTAQFWFVWQLFAERVRQARWVSRLKDEYSTGNEMVSAIFLGSWWKEDVRHWRSLEGYSHHVHALFEALPPSSIVLDDYVRFLYHIGERSLPEAFVRVANSLKRGDAQAMLQKTNTVFLLEVLLQRHVYGRPLELKRDRAIREAVLFLLDTLVENGSSAAFRMRDDFVTPGPN